MPSEFDSESCKHEQVVYSQPHFRPLSGLQLHPRMKSSESLVTPVPRILSLMNLKSIGSVELSTSLHNDTTGALNASSLGVKLCSRLWSKYPVSKRSIVSLIGLTMKIQIEQNMPFEFS